LIENLLMAGFLKSLFSMQRSILVAVSKNGVIGRDNQLIWRLPDDLKNFKALTLGHPIIMGRKTWDSIGRALPGRTSIVLSRSQPALPAGVLVASSLSDAIEMAGKQETKECFIIGGGEVYRQAMAEGLVDKIYLTQVHAEVEGDAWFRLPDETQWEVLNRTFHPADEQHAYAFDFIELELLK
jgi:dihydrofolate reductase